MKANAEKLKGIPTPTSAGVRTPSFKGGSETEDEKSGFPVNSPDVAMGIAGPGALGGGGASAAPVAPVIPPIEELYKIEDGGIIDPPIERTTKNCAKLPKIKEGQTLEKFIKDPADKKIGKTANMKATEAREKLSDICKDVAMLDVSEKIAVRVPIVEELFEEVSKINDLSLVHIHTIFVLFVVCVAYMLSLWCEHEIQQVIEQ